MVLHRDRAAHALARTNGPVLLEGPRAVDLEGEKSMSGNPKILRSLPARVISTYRRCVSAGGDVDVVGAAVAVDRTLVLCTRRGIIRAERLDDVVLHQRVPRPAVDGEVGVARWVVGAGVSDRSVGRSTMLSLVPPVKKRGLAHRPVPVAQPLPATKLLQFCQSTEYCPPGPLV